MTRVSPFPGTRRSRRRKKKKKYKGKKKEKIKSVKRLKKPTASLLHEGL